MLHKDLRQGQSIVIERTKTATQDIGRLGSPSKWAQYKSYAEGNIRWACSGNISFTDANRVATLRTHTCSSRLAIGIAVVRDAPQIDIMVISHDYSE
jgi:hypothetical protein